MIALLFVGRQAEIAELRRQLGVGRVVTLTGPGGVGKTRLAVHVMPLPAADFADGAVFVGLVELRDGELLPNLVADRLGLHAGGSPGPRARARHLGDVRAMAGQDRRCRPRLTAAADIAARTGDEVLDAHILTARAFRLVQLSRPGTSALAASAAAIFRKYRRELQPLFLRGMAVIRATCPQEGGESGWHTRSAPPSVRMCWWSG